MRARAVASLSLLVLAVPSAWAEEAPPSPSADAEVQRMRDEMNRRFEELQRQRTEERQQMDQRVEELQQRVEEMETESQKRLADNRLRLYGFASFLFGKAWTKPGNSSGMDAYVADDSTFSLGDFNLFVDSQPWEAWRFLAEIRFVSAPTGRRIINQTTGEIAQEDSSFIDTVYTGSEQLNGLVFQRVQAEYRLSDAFGVTVGRFLTPYGIWNVEHGAPMLIPVRMPYMVLNGVVPRSQLGFYVSGRFFPADQVQLEYAVTVSNGGGPTGNVYDLDENKAVGVRLRGQWQQGKSRVAGGTYLYAGEATNRMKQIVGLNPLRIQNVNISHATEKSVAVDLLIEHGRLRLQGEYARTMVRYLDNLRPANPYVPGAYLPDTINQGAYGLAAYQLPFQKLDVRLYGMFEWAPDLFKAYTAGVNWRISPTIVWKAEASYIFLDSPDWKLVQTQLALSY